MEERLGWIGAAVAAVDGMIKNMSLCFLCFLSFFEFLLFITSLPSILRPTTSFACLSHFPLRFDVFEIYRYCPLKSLHHS